MSSTSRKGPIVDPGLCRCCGGLKKCRLLNVEYEWQGQREVYSEMFVDCFGLLVCFCFNKTFFNYYTSMEEISSSLCSLVLFTIVCS